MVYYFCETISIFGGGVIEDGLVVFDASILALRAAAAMYDP